MDEFDVIVAGGGPAGAWTARLLALDGWSVAIWDRATFPRDKPCGDYLSPGAVGILRDGGLSSVLDGLPTTTVSTIRVHDASGRWFEGSLAEDGGGLSVRRLHLDAALLRAAAEAGARVFEGRSCVSHSVSGGSVTVSGRERGEAVSARCRLLVGADGGTSGVARRMGVVRALPRRTRLALVSHVHGISGVGDAIELHPNERGCVGIGPGVGGECNVTVVAPVSESRRISEDARAYARGAMRSCPGLRDRIEDVRWETDPLAIGTFAHTARRVTGDGVALVGDAASFIDPFTGEGVYCALRGAGHLAETAAQALRTGPVTRETLSSYERARAGELRRRYLLCRVIQSVVGAPRVLGWFGARLRHRPEAARMLLRTTGDVLPPGAVLSPRFLARLLG